MAHKRATLKEIADYCGVSTATISRVLNDNGRFSEETRCRVLDAVHRFNYFPNATAKALRTQSTRLVGIFVNALEYEMTGITIAKLQQCLSEHGYVSIICNIGDEPGKEDVYYQMLLSQNVCGVIMLVMRSLPVLFRQEGIPTIFIYKNPLPTQMDENTCVIETDNFEAGYLAGRELCTLQCRSVAEIRMKNVNDRVPMGRHVGLLQALYESGVPYDEARSIIIEDSSFAGICQAIQTSIRTSGVADGYFCASDLFALALIRCLEASGHQVPEEIKIIGCNDMALAMYNNKPITTIRHRIDDICNAAVDCLTHMISGTLPEEHRSQIFGVTLVHRETT